MKKLATIPVLTFILLASVAPALAYEPVTLWPKGVTQKSQWPRSFYGLHFQEEEGYTENWNFALRFKSGHILFARVMVSNMGPGNKNLGIIAHMLTPDGIKFEIHNGRRPGQKDYLLKAKPLKMRIRWHSLGFKGPNFHMHLHKWLFNKEFDLKLKISPVAGGYHPKKVYFGEEKGDFVAYSVPFPKAWATGEVKWGKETVKLEGIGFGDHLYTNNHLHRLARAILSFQAFKKGWTINLFEFSTTRRFGKKRVPLLTVLNKGKVVFSTNDYQLKFGRLYKDRRSLAKYWVPRKFTFEHHGPNGDYIRGVVNATRLLHRYDVLKGLPRIVRFIMQKLSKPVWYRFKVRYSIRGRIGGKRIKLNGTSMSQIIRVNR